MKKGVLLIDGFNLYHSLDNNPAYHRYKWLDLKGLANAFVQKSEVITEIYYFTSLAKWNRAKVEKHKLLLNSYYDLGIKVIMGEFRNRPRTCPICRKQYNSKEEKRTDVNIAVTLLDLAHNNKFDCAFILSGDSDLIPAISYVKNNFRGKTIKVIVPIGGRAEELTKVCGGNSFRIHLKEDHLKRNLLPDPFLLKNGDKISCPPEWK